MTGSDRFLGPVRGNVAHEPFGTAVLFFPRTAVGEASDIARRILRGTLILVDAP